MDAPTDLRQLAHDIAVEAGDRAARLRGEGVAIAASKSSVADIVTEADREVEDLIRQRLAAARPNDGFLGEESEPEVGTTGITWVVDPIDGTVNYAYGNPQWAVSIAAVTDGREPRSWTALAGVVYSPVVGELFEAARGEGATLAGGEIRVSDVGPAGALIATGFGYDPATHAQTLGEIGRMLPRARDLRRAGAASLDLAYVASGRLDAYAERGLQPWDLAAGALLVREAGGSVIFGDVDPFGRRMLVAGSTGLADELSSALAG